MSKEKNLDENRRHRPRLDLLNVWDAWRWQWAPVTELGCWRNGGSTSLI